MSSILIFFVLVLLSAYFSSSETAFTSASRIRLKNEAKNGDNRAKLAYDLQEKYDSLLSTVLIGNNIVNIASSSIATIFFVELYPTYGATIATLVTTAILLLFSEIAPKLIAKISPEPLAKFSAPILRILMVIFTPLVWLVGQWQNFIRKIVPVDTDSAISEEELLSIVDEARTGGSIESDEHRLVKAAIEFDDVDVSRIVTPRVDVIGFDIEASDEEIERKYEQTPYSRLIVYEDTIDNVVGILHEKDFYRYSKAKNNNTLKYSSLESLLTEVFFVPPVIPLSELLKTMQREQVHMAIVVDEHGGTLGIATMEDALEELVGEIWDETDTVKQEVKELDEDKGYLIRGTYSLEKLFHLFDREAENQWLSNTVNGFIIEQLERVPQTGDQFEYKELSFKITDAQKRRVNEVIIKEIETNENETKQENDL